MKCPFCPNNFDRVEAEDGLHWHIGTEHPDRSKTLMVHTMGMNGQAEVSVPHDGNTTMTAVSVLARDSDGNMEFRAFVMTPEQTEWFVKHFRVAMDQQAGLVHHEEPRRSRWDWWRGLRARWGLSV